MIYSTVLLVSDDPEFSRGIQARWLTQSLRPNFIVMASDLCRGIDPEQFDVGIVGGIGSEAMKEVLANLAASGKATILVCESHSNYRAIRKLHPSVILVPNYESWLDNAVLIGAQALACAAATDRAGAIESQHADREREAALGRYTVEMRHSLNNALTSVLGNAELLLLDPGALGPEACAQVETIRNMALRIHEFLLRFSSLEKEMSAIESVGRHGMGSSAVSRVNVSY